MRNNFCDLGIRNEILPLCFKSSSDEFLCKMILSAHLSKPRGIALDPNEGFMFFTVWGSEQAKLERASLGKCFISDAFRYFAVIFSNL